MDNLETQIRDYFEEIAPPHEGDYRSRALVPAKQVRRLARGWVVASAAAVAVLVLAGVAVILTVDGPGPVVTVPPDPVQTTIPTPTTAPPPVSTTLAEPEALVKDGFIPVQGWVEAPLGSASSSGVSGSENSEKVTAIAIGPDDIPYAAWESNEPGNRNAEIYLKAFVDGEWVDVDGSATDGGVSATADRSSLVPSVAVASDGVVFVAWEEQSAGQDFRIHVKLYDGESWSEAGLGSAAGDGVSPGASNTWQANLAAGPDGTMFLAWVQETAGRADVFVKQFTGETWDEVGVGSASDGGVSGTGLVGDMDLAVGPDGLPVAIWRDNGHDGGAVYIRKFDGVSWVELGAGSATGSGLLDAESSEPYFVQVAVGPNDEVYAAWNHTVGGRTQIHAMVHRDGIWTVMGESPEPGASPVSGLTSELAVWPSLAVNASGIPAIVWQEVPEGTDGSGFRIYVKVFVEGAWLELGEGSGSGSGLSGGTPAVHGTIAYDSTGSLFVVFRDDGIGIQGEIAGLVHPADTSG